MNDDSHRLSRRDILKNAATVIGGSALAVQLVPFAIRAAAAAAENAAPVFFSSEQFSMIESMAELIIPETDTPGAIGAGVPHFIDLMIVELTLLLTWFNPFSWLISRMIKENHEHLADRQVLSAGIKQILPSW